MSKILIVGGTGFLGEACLRKLSSSNLDVFIIGRKEKIWLADPKKFTYHQLDINSLKDVESFLKQENYSHLLYLAWPPSPPHNSIDHITFAASSITFLKIFAQYNPEARVVFTGSIYETGINTGKVPNNFQNMCPKNLYGLSKKFVWECVNALQASNDFNILSFCWVRLSNIYGAGDHAYKALHYIVENTINKKNINLNNPNAFVDFINIEDAATGIIHALLAGYNGVINIGGGCGYLLRDIKNFIWLYCEMGKKNILKIEPFINSEFGPVLDTTATQDILGYSPSVPIEDGIIEYIEFLHNKVRTYAKN